MQYRELGRTGWRVSAISFGAWAIGSAWGSVDDRASLDALRRAVDLGVNFFDTADVYGDGRSERLLAQLKRERREETHIATKAGCRLETKHSPVSILNWDCKRLKNCARLYRRVGRWRSSHCAGY